VRCGGFAQIAVAGVSLALVLAGAPFGSARAASTTPTASFVLDGVQLSVTAGALGELSTFDAAPAGSAVQSASATAQDPYRELSVEAVPFGTEDADDPALGVAVPGGAASAGSTLQQYRVSQKASPLPTVTATLFGEQVTGAANLLQLQVDSSTASPVVVIDWVADAGSRLWVVRASQQLADTSTASWTAAETEFSDVSVNAANLLVPTTVGVTQSAQGGSTSGTTEAPANANPTDMTPVAFPSWWSGTCNTNNYQAASGQLAHLLSAGAVWDGLEACGPRPGYNEGPDESVDLPGAQWSVLEWECVELSMRWMYLAWNVEPFPANGKGVVWNYSAFEAQYDSSGPTLVTTANDGSGSLPEPGDVLSYGATTTYGHTSVVTAVDVDNNGNGNISVLEQNASPTGWDTVPVSDWVLGGLDGGVSGWLHDPGFSVNEPRSTTEEASLGNGRTEVVWRGRDGNLWRAYSPSPGTWQAAASLGGGPLGSDPFPIGSEPGVVDVFWRGTDNALWHMWYTDSGGWQGPQQLTAPNLLASDPHPITNGAGRIDVFWTGANGNLWSITYLSGSGWGTAASDGAGPLGSDPAPVWVAPGVIDVFWEGTDHGLWHEFSVNGHWSGAQNLSPLPMGSPPTAIATATYQVDVFWEGTDTHLWSVAYDNGWQSARGLGSVPLGSQPEPDLMAPGVLDVFWVGPSTNLWHETDIYGSWTAPSSLGNGPLTTAPAVVSSTPGIINVSWRGSDGNVWQLAYDNGWQAAANCLGGGPLP
jgi:hypothetical protein